MGEAVAVMGSGNVGLSAPTELIVSTPAVTLDNVPMLGVAESAAGASQVTLPSGSMASLMTLTTPTRVLDAPRMVTSVVESTTAPINPSNPALKPDVMDAMVKLLQAQADAMATQA